jgi:hypothetical protein
MAIRHHKIGLAALYVKIQRAKALYGIDTKENVMSLTEAADLFQIDTQTVGILY